MSRRGYAAGLAQVILDHVEKIYSGSVKAINGLSLDVKDGEFMVFVGPSGCGKSTALRSIAGLKEITAGKIQIGDRVVSDLPPKDWDDDDDDSVSALVGGKSLWTVRVSARSSVKPGQPVELGVDTRNLHFFAPSSGLSTGHPKATAQRAEHG